VADIDFCESDSRAEASDSLCAEIQGLIPRWEFFANDSVSCEANIRARNRSCLQDDLNRLARYSRSYNIPQGALVLFRLAETMKSDNWPPATGNCL
jgi:hypothetical protein